MVTMKIRAMLIRAKHRIARNTEMISSVSFMLSILQVFWGMSRANRSDFASQVAPLHLTDVAVVLRDVDLVRGLGVQGLIPDLQNVRLGAVTRTESSDGSAVEVIVFHVVHSTDFWGAYKGKADLFFRS